jgi:hypothetical protein
MGFRVFEFEGVTDDRVRSEYTVRADLALIRRYAIQVQELPLLCRGLLERQGEAVAPHTLTFTEEHMRLHADACAAVRRAAALKKKPPNRPPRDSSGSPWRNPRPPGDPSL